jgi:hypothetical protein
VAGQDDDRKGGKNATAMLPPTRLANSTAPIDSARTAIRCAVTRKPRLLA